MTLASRDKSNRLITACLVVTDGPFQQWRVIEATGETEAEAVANCKSTAEQEGWQPPQWWQWWRRRDSQSVKVAITL